MLCKSSRAEVSMFVAQLREAGVRKVSALDLITQVSSGGPGTHHQVVLAVLPLLSWECLQSPPTQIDRNPLLCFLCQFLGLPAQGDPRNGFPFFSLLHMITVFSCSTLSTQAHGRVRGRRKYTPTFQMKESHPSVCVHMPPCMMLYQFHL